MNKCCTAPDCRKVFSTLEYGGRCPFCGKLYPTLEGKITKKRCNVILVSFGTEKIKVIKEVRNITGLGLAEAKALAETPYAEIRVGIPKRDAEALKTQLEAVGAKVVIRYNKQSR